MSENHPAIYAIVHRDSGRLYVGSTIKHRNRWACHRSLLRRGKHPNPKLQGVWTKHGEDQFDFKVVQILDDVLDLVFWEQFWLDKLKPHLNIRVVAENNTGIRKAPGSYKPREPMTPEADAQWRQRMSEAGKKRVRDPEMFQRIADKLRGRPLDQEHRRKLSEAHKGNKQSPEAIAKTTAALVKEWAFVDPQGQMVRFSNLRAFCREHGLNSGTMQSVNNGSRASHKGWTRYQEFVE